jgi:hypothetical protein
MRKGFAILLIISSFLTIQIFSFGSESQRQQIEIPSISPNYYGKGYRYNIQGWVYIHIEGTPYERGYQYGSLAAPEIIDMIYRWSNWIHNIGIIKILPIKNRWLPKGWLR